MTRDGWRTIRLFNFMMDFLNGLSNIYNIYNLIHTFNRRRVRGQAYGEQNE